MSKGVVPTVGNSLMGDDGAGPLLAELLDAEPAPGWVAVDGGGAPENVVHAVRAERPDRVLLVDAADMRLEPGAVRRVETDDVARPSVFNTHVIPLDLLIRSLQETVPRVTFLGVQPACVEFYAGMTAEVREAVVRVHRHLVNGGDPDQWPGLFPADESGAPVPLAPDLAGP